ncbi:MAG: tyrosine-type recombinase/integrase [Candidatus Sumerlaeales bacterium]|nr:tyrosine-type recombinase/integrase [Candidatus Sumerlaeales bacterium]
MQEAIQEDNLIQSEGSLDNVVYLSSSLGKNPAYMDRQRKGAGTRTVQPLEHYDQIAQLFQYLKKEKRYRDYALITTGLATGLRISDLVRLTFSDVFASISQREFKPTIAIHQKKTGKPTVTQYDEMVITPIIIVAITKYLDKTTWMHEPSDALFASREGTASSHISESQGWRIVKGAIEDAGVPIKAGSHTLRKTFLNIANAIGHSSKISMNNGSVLSDVMVLAGHSKISTTLRYTTLAKSRLISLRQGVSSFLQGRTKVKDLKMEYVWDDVD